LVTSQIGRTIINLTKLLNCEAVQIKLKAAALEQQAQASSKSTQKKLLWSI